MLSLRPSCEHCNKLLPPDSDEAMICSYECTFCQCCVDAILQNVCPNCGGGFTSRPVRPKHNLKNDSYLGKHPASTTVIYAPVDQGKHKNFAAKIKLIVPHDR